MLANKIAAFIGHCHIGLRSFTILKNHTPLNERDALTITVISLLWPFYTALTSIAILPHIIDMALFYTGWLIYLQNRGHARYIAMAHDRPVVFSQCVHYVPLQLSLEFIFCWRTRQRG